MPKRIVVFSDGTGNSAARLQKSNVWRLYQAVERMPDQIAYYDDGVGTAAWKPLALIGGAIGFGLARNVQDIYAFICRNYAPGDEIYAFGFSRGAFTIRILGGLIAGRGLIPPGPNLDDRVALEWRKYRGKYGRFGRTNPAETRQHDVTINFMGLWDTVDAYGFPVEELRIAWDYLILPLSMRDRELSKKVMKSCHALAIDDERQTFHPVLWTEAGEVPAQTIAEERITQVWFAGVHSNLGGGYPDDTLSYVSLNWMMAQAERRGLVFNADYKRFIQDEADESGKIYNPRGGLSALYRYMPRSIRDLSRDLNRNGEGYSVYIERPKIHESVFRRLRNGTDEYAPLTLPQDYDLVLDDGRIVPGVVEIGGQETPEQAKQRCGLQDRLWDLVWRRSWLYRATLFVTVVILILPWTIDPRWIAWGGWTDSLGFVITLIAALVPDFASGWLDFYRTNPVLLAALLIAAFYLGARGARREREIRDLMYLIWSQSLRGGPDPQAGLPSGRVNRIASSWRGDKWRRIFKYNLVPKLVSALYILAGLSILNVAGTAVVESFGGICRKPDTTSSPGTMSLTEACHQTGTMATKGETYRILVGVATPWFDKSIPASPDGLVYEDFGSWLAMKLAVPLRRHITVDWFKVMAKIGSDGLNSEPLDLRRLEGTDANGLQTWEADFTANADGPLLIYVNDAVLLGSTWLYGNNAGTAKIGIELKAR